HKLLLFSLMNWCCSISAVSEGFNQIIDFLNGSYIKHALTINPHIYVSCIKQFSNNVVVKQSNDVTRLQALVDKKKVVITEATIRDALRLDDAEGVDCLPNEEIFAELARMGYEKPSTKLTFYKAFFLSQWKFLIHTILQSLSTKRTSWNAFSSAMASAVICLSTGQKFNFSEYIFESLVRNVDSSSKFYTYPRFIQLIIQNQLGNLLTHTTIYTSPALTQKDFTNIRRVGKGFLEVETPLFEGMLVAGELEEQGNAEEQVQDDVDAAAQGADTAVQRDDVHELSIPSPTPPTPPPQQSQDLPIHTSRRMIDELDRDKGVALMDDERAENKAEEAQVAGDDQVKGRQAEIYQIDMLSMQEDEPEVQEVVDVVTTAKLITKVVTAASESVNASSITIVDAEPQVPTAKEDPYVQRYQVMKKMPQIEAHARRNMIMYLKNVAGFKLDYFKGMYYDDIPQKAAKRRKLNEEVEDLKQHLEIVPDEDDDVCTEATPLARKVLVVDYEIIHFNNKPHYKIIRADGTHRLYMSFITLLKNFDREDLESLWSLVKERFSTSKPNNFSDDYLLTTLGAMFKRSDGQAQVWKNQRIVHGQAKVKSWKLLESCGVHIITFATTQLILLVERRYPLLRKPVDHTDYRSMIGSLMYVTSSRPDIMFATCMCARYQENPNEHHVSAVKRIFRSLKGTINLGLWYPKDSDFDLTAYSDADHAGYHFNRKSTSGSVQFLGDKLVCWSSKKQNCVSISIAESEYVAVSSCCAQVLWMRTQLTDYSFFYDKVPIYCDSKSVIAISCNPVQHTRTKHIDVRYHFIKDHVEKGSIELYFVCTEYELADLFTKSLPEARFKFLVEKLGMMSRET
nr:copia protein [Tanacetum cinerariifolium]